MNRRVLSALGAACLLAAQALHPQRSAHAEAGKHGQRGKDARRIGYGRSPDWLTRIPESDRQSAHRFNRRNDGGFVSPTWIRDVEARVDGSGVRVSSRRPGEEDQALAMRLVRFGRQGVEREVPAGQVSAISDRVELHRGEITEWFRFDERGIEQGFTIPGPPPVGPADLPVVLEMRLTGPLASRAGLEDEGVVFRTRAGEIALRYEGLKVKDAMGAPVVASLALVAAGMQIRIQDAGASYPLTIDPLLSTPAWTSSFGTQVSSAGDVNADGFGDVLVSSSGVAYLFQGSPGGLSPSPDWTSPQGGLIAGAGDFNGDGFDDVLVSSLSPSGRPLLYHGSSAGLSATPSWTPAPTPDTPEVRSLAAAGDVNGDGFGDLILGSAYGSYVSAARIYLGAATSPDSSPSWTVTQANPFTALGHSVASAGDVNGDGFADVLVGEPLHGYVDPFEAPAAGRARIYLGSSRGPETDPAWLSQRVAQFGWFGSSVSGAGDVNADGYGDVIVGGVNGFRGTEQGVAQVFLGSSSGPGTVPVLDVLGDGMLAHLGTSVSGAGDVDGDGFDDLLVGEPDYDLPAGPESAGRAYLYSGNAGGVAGSPAWNAEGDHSFHGVGISVATAGDVNDDGYSDVVVGSFDGASLYLGAPDNHPPVAHAAAAAQAECTSPSGAAVLLDGSGSTDADSTAGTSDDIAVYEWFEDFGAPGQELIAGGALASPILARGVHALTLRVTDSAGATATESLVVEVADTRTPTLSLNLTRSLLWPPNHRMVTIHAQASAGDACGPAAVVLLSIVSDEPDDATGSADGATLNDVDSAAPGSADFEFRLRAERSDTGDGRVYTVVYKATDAAGNITTAARKVTVPLHHRDTPPRKGPRAHSRPQATDGGDR